MVLFLWRLPSGSATLCQALSMWLWPACPTVHPSLQGLADVPRHGGHPGVHTVLPAQEFSVGPELPALGCPHRPPDEGPRGCCGGCASGVLGLVVWSPHWHARVNRTRCEHRWAGDISVRRPQTHPLHPLRWVGVPSRLPQFQCRRFCHLAC